ncbi:MAG: hypothetical protein ABJP70_11075 [Erythrobacter sp.]
MAQAQTGAPEQSVDEDVAGAVSKPFDGKNIPKKLKKVQNKPYSLKGMGSCSAIRQEILELDEVLGPDVNVKTSKSKGKKREETAGRVASGAVGSIIPFGGLIGEVSGANAKRRKYNRAVYAGTVRRGFLKGVGLERGCAAPARP